MTLTVEAYSIVCQLHTLIPSSLRRCCLGVDRVEVASGRQRVGVGYRVSTRRGRRITTRQSIDIASHFGFGAFGKILPVFAYVFHSTLYLEYSLEELFVLLGVVFGFGHRASCRHHIRRHTSALSVCSFFAHIGRVLRLGSRSGFSRLRHIFGHIHRVACRLRHRASHRFRLLLRHILWVLPFGHILRHSVGHITLLASVGHSFCHHTLRHSIAFFRPAHTHHSCHHTAGTVTCFGIFTCKPELVGSYLCRTTDKLVCRQRRLLE